MFEKPLNLDTIFSHSNHYVSEKLSAVPHNIDTSNNEALILSEFETDDEYASRVNNVILDLRTKYSGNLLIVTHADAYRQYNLAGRAMKYGEVYDIELPVKDMGGGASNNYKFKYAKYKNKYFELKNKQ
jgi:broad specificity phosphatase PhoE